MAAYAHKEKGAWWFVHYRPLARDTQRVGCCALLGQMVRNHNEPYQAYTQQYYYFILTIRE